MNISNRIISLAGKWHFSLDPQNIGIEEKWFNKELEGVITLPGSVEENGYGDKVNIIDRLRLNRRYIYTGVAWFQYSVKIPKSWEGKKITFLMERCLWETRVWIGDIFVSMENNLSKSHEYEMTNLLIPGTHRITVRVDNTQKYNIGTWGHAYSDDMQTIWNGIFGKIKLYCQDPVYIENIQAYPEFESKKVRVVTYIESIYKKHVDLNLSININQVGVEKPGYSKEIVSVIKDSSLVFETTIPLQKEEWLWDEFTPNLYRVNVELNSNVNPFCFKDVKHITFGMRKFESLNTQFILNKQPIFLRGTLDCGSFPLTGYPDMDRESWRKIFNIGKAYVLNHFIHSWCPPEAAFEAADEFGIYLQTELPFFPLTNNPNEIIFSPDDCVPPLGADKEREQFFRNVEN